MDFLIKALFTLLALAVLIIIGFNLWGYLTLGSLTPEKEPLYDNQANRVVMVFGATGSAGDGLLKAVIEDSSVKKVYVITRRSSERIDAGVASGKVEMRLHKDFTDYQSLADILSGVDTVLWGLGTSSLNVDKATYRLIHVDFPLAFVKTWLSTKPGGPLSFHFITGMGTDGTAYWAQQKRHTEIELAKLAQSTNLRTFSYRAAYIRPTSEQAHSGHLLMEKLARPGNLVTTGKELGQAMLEISARTSELRNGTLIDAADANAYAAAYQQHRKNK